MLACVHQARTDHISNKGQIRFHPRPRHEADCSFIQAKFSAAYYFTSCSVLFHHTQCVREGFLDSDFVLET